MILMMNASIWNITQNNLVLIGLNSILFDDFSTLQRTRRSLPKEGTLNINVNISYSAKRFKKRRRKSLIDNSECKEQQNIAENTLESNKPIQIERTSSDVKSEKTSASTVNTNNEKKLNLSNISNVLLEDYDNNQRSTSIFKNDNSCINEDVSVKNSINSANVSFTCLSDEKPQKNRSGYFSMSSKVIKACNTSKLSSPSDLSENFADEIEEVIMCDNLREVPNVFIQKTYTVFYFEVNYIMIWMKDYLKSLYPELNFILLIEIDDDKETQEKIPLMKTKENNRYVPMFKREDLMLNDAAFHYMKIVKNEETQINASEKYKSCSFTANTNSSVIHKISIQLCTYAKNRLIPISQDDMYIQIRSENQMIKYKLYKNMNSKYNNKKVGNVLFNFSYKKETSTFKNTINNSNSQCNFNSILFKHFNDVDKISTYEEESSHLFIYNNIRNLSIKQNGSICDYSKDSNFFSIHDIEEVELSGELRSNKIKLERLLELLGLVKKKYEFYEVLKKLNSYIKKKELDEEKLLQFKEKIVKRLEELTENKELCELYDQILIPYIFLTMKNLFFKPFTIKRNSQRKDSLIKFKDEIINIFDMSENGSKENKNIDKEKSLILLINSFKFSFRFLEKMEKEIHTDILLSSINYIFKIFEEINKFEYPNLSITKIEECLNINENCQIKPKLLEECLFYFISNNNLHNLLIKILISHYDNQSCILPVTGILSKFLKIKKDIVFIKLLMHEQHKENIKSILKIHEANSMIMTNIFSILCNFLDVMDADELLKIVNYEQMKETFFNFKMNGFDHIHESILYLVKAILIKKNSSPKFIFKAKEAGEIIAIFACAFQLIKTKIGLLDTPKTSKWFFSLMTIIYTMANIINNFNSKLKDISKLCVEKKISEGVIDIFFTLYEKKLLSSVDNKNEKFDGNSLNNKIMLFRTLFHCIILIKTLNEYDTASMPKSSAEKIYIIIKCIEDNDSLYNPIEIGKRIEKVKYFI